MQIGSQSQLHVLVDVLEIQLEPLPEKSVGAKLRYHAKETATHGSHTFEPRPASITQIFCVHMVHVVSHDS